MRVKDAEINCQQNKKRTEKIQQVVLELSVFFSSDRNKNFETQHCSYYNQSLNEVPIDRTSTDNKGTEASCLPLQTLSTSFLIKKQTLPGQICSENAEKPVNNPLQSYSAATEGSARQKTSKFDRSSPDFHSL